MYIAYMIGSPIFMKLQNSASSLPTFFFCLLLFGVHGEARLTLPKDVNVPAVIAFGDSIVDQGANNNLNTLIKANFSPYGKDFVDGKPTGRFSNNKTPADMIVEELGIKEHLPAYLQPSLDEKELLTGVSFGSGGSGYDPQTPKIVVIKIVEELGIKEHLPAYLQPSLDEKELLTGVSFGSGGSGYDPQTPKIVGVFSFADQLHQFKEYIEKLKRIVGKERTQNILENSIFLVVAGSDDLANTYFTIGIRRLQYDIPSYTELMVSSASNFIKDIYQLGARRIGVFSAPPIGCLPSQRTLGGGGLRVCVEEYNKAAQLYNNKLQQELAYLKKTLVQSRIVCLDIYNPIIEIIENPLKYGLEVVDRGCCGSGNIEVSILCNHLLPTCSDDSKYLFWDSYHPTNKGYNILVNQLLGKYINSFF